MVFFMVKQANKQHEDCPGVLKKMITKKAPVKSIRLVVEGYMTGFPETQYSKEWMCGSKEQVLDRATFAIRQAIKTGCDECYFYLKEMKPQ